jgi:hypothetical protein
MTRRTTLIVLATLAAVAITSLVPNSASAWSRFQYGAGWHYGSGWHSAFYQNQYSTHSRPISPAVMRRPRWW